MEPHIERKYLADARNPMLRLLRAGPHRDPAPDAAPTVATLVGTRGGGIPVDYPSPLG